MLMPIFVIWNGELVGPGFHQISPALMNSEGDLARRPRHAENPVGDVAVQANIDWSSVDFIISSCNRRNAFSAPSPYDCQYTIILQIVKQEYVLV
jgi:hypothetical protein